MNAWKDLGFILRSAVDQTEIKGGFLRSADLEMENSGDAHGEKLQVQTSRQQVRRSV